MKENDDVEAFDIAKAELIVDRSYFENGKLLHQVNNEDCGSPFESKYLTEEQNRIMANFDRLVTQSESNKKPNR